MYIQTTETGIIYQSKELSYTPSYQEIFNVFAENDIFRYNDRDVEATSHNKCTVNEATKTVRVPIPLGNNSYIRLHWHRDLSIPLTTKVFYQEINQRWPAINYSYSDLTQQCKEGQIGLQLHCTSPLAGKTIKTCNINKTTTAQDIQKMFTCCNAEYQVFHNVITFTDSILDGVKCRVQIKLDEDNTVESISFYPNYQFDCDVFGSTSETAKLCHKKLMEEIDLQPKTNNNQKDKFFLLYDFDKVKLSASLSYTPRDGYPEWSGIVVYFM